LCSASLGDIVSVISLGFTVGDHFKQFSLFAGGGPIDFGDELLSDLVLLTLLLFVNFRNIE
jgi:hypothetical protein